MGRPIQGTEVIGQEERTVRRVIRGTKDNPTREDKGIFSYREGGDKKFPRPEDVNGYLMTSKTEN